MGQRGRRGKRQRGEEVGAKARRGRNIYEGMELVGIEGEGRGRGIGEKNGRVRRVEGTVRGRTGRGKVKGER